MILSSADVDTVLHQILLVVRNYFEVTNCGVLLVDPGTNELYVRAQIGYDPAETRRYRIGEDGICGWVAANKTPLYVPDVSQEPRYIKVAGNVRSELSLPLLVREEIIGVLDIESEHLDYFSDEMIGLLALFAGQAAVALENARLYSTERRRMRQIELINLIARSATGITQVDDLAGTLVDLIYDTFEGTDVAILLKEGDHLTLRANAGATRPRLERFQNSERNGLISQAFQKRTNVVTDNVRSEPNWPACLTDTGSEMCVPLVSFGETVGAIVIASGRPNAFNEDDRAIAQAAGDVCATAIKNVQLAEELRRVTSTDFLTGIYNQRYFHTAVTQEVARARRYNKRFALAMLDLRDFHHVNDAVGFDGGDEVLRQVAHALQSQLRSNDTLCRYAGDRFAIVLPETDRERVSAVLAKMEDGLKQIQYHTSDGPGRISAIYAFVHYPPDGSNELELIRALLVRVQKAKQMGSAAAS